MWRLAIEEDWRRDLKQWLEPYLQALANKTRQRMCPAYIAGLIGPGDRKSIQPMAAPIDALSYDRLHHFVGAGDLGQHAAGGDVVATG